MHKNLKVSLLLISLIFTACTGYNGAKVVLPNQTEIAIELAITPEEKMQGLMYRESLEEKSGMLFINENAAMLSFWMKNTYIPLDIIFIDENREIINIEKADPCKQEKCPLYKSKGEAKYVLEINQGDSSKYDLKKGDKLVFKNIYE
jgi:uncharacterized membrane protein (UPF0127 family)